MFKNVSPFRPSIYLVEWCYSTNEVEIPAMRETADE